MSALKTCSACGEAKPLKLYTEHRGTRDGLQTRCALCVMHAVRVSRPRDYRYFRNRDLLGRYGITIEQYDAKWDAQGGLCAICERPETQIHNGRLRWLSVDHNHRTSEVRGLLCSNCNRAIGYLQDNHDRALRAACYLEEWL